MPKKKIKKTKSAPRSSKKEHDIFEKHTSLKWLLPIFIAIAVVFFMSLPK